MTSTDTDAGTRHVSRVIARPWREVHAYAADPRNLVHWASGLATATVTPLDDGSWSASSPFGDVTVRFVPPNDLGVLDHTVRMPDGTEVLNPLRVLPHDDGAEVVFTVRRRPGMTDDDVARDAAVVATDLETLRGRCEAAAAG
ncbi:SRPBCC family protein [Actinomycetospora sp. TBRC 11914]|uniref:SRPBCC family protein n=1 Tax=Actinomycetospora sp. TBRC 11914 TaxID=2729387 RepID=UPI00145F49E2|nr:SRPBCC family protein [Actinomycetospora sp. TBRC 11914]NMO88613.1 SRPBCC family protein [Actinomycetospora sp. TBRC 11914]